MSIRNPLIAGLMLQMPTETNVTSLDDRRLADEAIGEGQDHDSLLKVFNEETAKTKERASQERNWPGKEEVLDVATKEVRECWKLWAGRGGAFEHIKKAREKMGGISLHILNVGKAACKAAYARTDMSEDEQQSFALKLYEYAMDTAEANLRASIDPTEGDTLEAFEMFKKSSWNTYKSQMRGALKQGFNAQDFGTMTEVNKAVAQGKAGNGGQAQKDDDAPPAPGETKTASQLKTMFMDTAEQATRGRDTGKVQYAIAKLMENLGLIPEEVYEEKEEQIANIIVRAATEVLNLAGRATDASGVTKHTAKQTEVRTA